MKPLHHPIWREEIGFFVRLSIRQGLTQRESLRRYRAAGWTLSDAKFRAVWNDEKGSMLR